MDIIVNYVFLYVLFLFAVVTTIDDDKNYYPNSNFNSSS